MTSSKQSGTLYLIATPIGNFNDISYRAITTIKNSEYIAAENTKHTLKLLNHLGIKAKLISYNDHNEKTQANYLLDLLQQGQDIGMVSDAGTPLICDPGYTIVNIAREKGIKVVSIPGPCALITALCASGMPTDRFSFLGFLPSTASARQQKLTEMQEYPYTWIVYEAPHRILKSLTDMQKILSPERHIVIARELTKTFETMHSGTIENLLEVLHHSKDEQRGEFVVIIQGKAKSSQVKAEDMRLLFLLLAEMPIKKACSIVSETTGISKKILYQEALKLKDKTKIR
jgi:16S rRNA (cytidine1402-2'-O)-methyltransferase